MVYNVAGPWIDRVFEPGTAPSQPRLNGGTKGSHLVVERFPGAPDDVVAIDHDHDGRDAFLVLSGAGWPAPLQLIEAVRR